MGTAYAEMERFPDAIKCYEQSMPRGLSEEEKKRAKNRFDDAQFSKRAEKETSRR